MKNNFIIIIKFKKIQKDIIRKQVLKQSEKKE